MGGELERAIACLINEGLCTVKKQDGKVKIESKINNFSIPIQLTESTKDIISHNQIHITHDEILEDFEWLRTQRT